MSLTAEQISAIDAAALAVESRREMRCQIGIADALKLAGLLPKELAIPEGPRDASRWSGRSLFREWLEGEGSAYFEEVDGSADPGDLVVFRLGHSAHHGGLMLSGGRLLHVFGEHGLRIAPCVPTAWAKRIDSTWRLR